MKRRSSTALLVAAVAVLAYFVLRPSDEGRIRAQLAVLAKVVAVDPADKSPATREQRIQEAFQRVLVPRVEVAVPEIVEDVYGREDLADMAASVSGVLRTLEVDVDKLRVEIDSAGRRAQVTGTATLTATGLDGTRETDVRDLSVRFEKVDGQWRIVGLTADPHRGDHT